MGGGHGQVLVYDGFWTCGFDGRLRRAGYLPEPFPENVDDLAAVVVTQAHDLDLAAELQRIDWLLPETVPVFVQCLDATLDAYFLDAEPKGRFIGFDPLFAASGRAATLIPGPGLTAESLGRAERFAISLGLLPLWISDSPGLVLPRVVAMLVNEAAFAVQEGVGTADGIDLAMRLGVNYPMGPVQWGRELGWARVLAVLEHLQSEFGEARYRPCQLLRRWARQESRGASGVAPLRRDPWDV